MELKKRQHFYFFLQYANFVYVKINFQVNMVLFHLTHNPLKDKSQRLIGFGILETRIQKIITYIFVKVLD